MQGSHGEEKSKYQFEAHTARSQPLDGVEAGSIAQTVMFAKANLVYAFALNSESNLAFTAVKSLIT